MKNAEFISKALGLSIPLWQRNVQRRCTDEVPLDALKLL